MSWTTNLLVIANRTVESDELLSMLRSRTLSGSIQVTLVAPADAGRVPTARRLERAVARMEDDGITVDGFVGHPDPLVAVEEVWDPRRFDEVIVVTLPTDVSRWMALDLPRRIERFTGARVTHLVATRGSGRPRDADLRVSDGVTVAVTDHAVERFRQRVGSRQGGFDVRPEIAGRVSSAWSAGRTSDVPPLGASEEAVRGSLYVRDLVDRGVIFVCRHDRASRELLVITLWEDERYGTPRVDQRFTDALKESDAALVDPGKRWRERRDR